MNNIYGIVLSGGTGTRMKNILPKQFSKLKGNSLLSIVVKRFKSWGFFKSIIIVANQDYLSQTEAEIKNELQPTDKIIVGGKTRHESVLAGISAIQFEENDIIVFHDCARPFFLFSELHDTCNAAVNYGAATVADGVTETVVTTLEKKVDSILNRDEIFLVKTPQAIHSSLLKLLLPQKLEYEPTDLCTWTNSIGVKPYIVKANPFNIKITKENDLELANLYYDLFQVLKENEKA